jgi:two-component system, NtrC family, nitrogen regulation sensor histidine kinase NtrY
MTNTRNATSSSRHYEQDRKKRRREGILILAVILIVILLTSVENRIIYFGADIPVSNTILMFILININLLLLILLIFLVFRNLVKLFYDRKKDITGARLKTKLVVSFIALTLLPTIILFFFSINFINNSIAFWFNVPVEQALENSLSVGRRFYSHAEENSRFFLERISFQITSKKMLEPGQINALSSYIQIVQREFNIPGVEIYDIHSNRLLYALSDKLADKPFEVVPADQLQKTIRSKGLSTISQSIPNGELIRTIGTVPASAAAESVEALVVLSFLIPPDLSESMEAISRGVEGYQQIKLLKTPIQISYYITLTIVALLVMFCAIWFGFALAKSISIPIMDLAEGTRRIAEGDLSFSIDLKADDEIGTLVNSFNKMTKDLRTGREQIELSTRMLKKQNMEIEARKNYMEIVLKNVSAGVVTVEPDGRISMINRAAEKMLGLNANHYLNTLNKKTPEASEPLFIHQIIEEFNRSDSHDAELPLKLDIDGRPRSFWAHVNSIKDESGRQMGIVMVFNDLTDLEKAQRMLAWREVARRIAHEVKNPLTPIALCAQRLKRRYGEKINDAVFDECTQMIIDHVDLIRNLVNEFAIFARFPTADPKPCDLASIIQETVALYKESHQNITFAVSIDDEIPKLNLDRQQIKQAMINLIDNAVYAIRHEGYISVALTHDPILKMVRLEIADDGVGIPDKEKTRLFEPDFSTKKTGMGLGLTIVHTIISDHNGRISVQDNQPRGAKFVIELPVAA